MRGGGMWMVQLTLMVGALVGCTSLAAARTPPTIVVATLNGTWGALMAAGRRARNIQATAPPASAARSAASASHPPLAHAQSSGPRAVAGVPLGAGGTIGAGGAAGLVDWAGAAAESEGGAGLGTGPLGVTHEDGGGGRGTGAG
jgi:hypothetical protein